MAINVPFLPGVPQLSSYLIGSVILLSADRVSPTFSSVGWTWGVFDSDGNIVLEPDSIISLEYKQEWLISDYPVEPSGFESYNKVDVPFDLRIRMTQGGSTGDRQSFLEQINAIKSDTKLYSVTTPEETYVNLNFIHYDFRRESHRGLGLLTVDMYFIEIRETATQSFTNTNAPADVDPVQGGAVQPKAPTTPQSALSSLIQ